MIVHRLHLNLQTGHTDLIQRLELARGGSDRFDAQRPVTSDADAFLTASSRHLAAVTEVLVPAVWDQRAGGPIVARQFLRECRQFERALVLAKGKLYGSAYAAQIPWARVWHHVARRFDRTLVAEYRMVSHLATDLGLERQELLVARWVEAEAKAPTRPHPYLPHRGTAGRVARWVWGHADRAWDYAEGRVIPASAGIELTGTTQHTQLPLTEPLPQTTSGVSV